MSRIDIEDLLDRYLKGEASAEEAERVKAWLNQTGHSGSEWQQMNKSNRDLWLANLFTEIEVSAGLKDNKVVKMWPQRNVWRSIAAVAAVLAIFFTLYLYEPALQNLFYPEQLTSLNVAINQKKEVTLVDGSRIWVNGGSVLKYPKAFNGKTREVYLAGEAYFDIRHDAKKPFIIHTGKVVTTVLGTAFNIKEDKDLHTIAVTVTRGKVSVANGDQPLGVITPNQQISFNTVSHQRRQTQVDAADVIAWQQNDLHFNNITFADAVLQLQQRFKIKISFSNERVKNCRFSGTALKEEKLDKILKVICAFNNAIYKTNADGSIVIDGPGCSKAVK